MPEVENPVRRASHKARPENYIRFALDEWPQQRRIFRRIVLQVSVLNNYVVPCRLADSPVQGRSLTHVSGLQKYSHPRMPGLQLGENFPRTVVRTVVHA